MEEKHQKSLQAATTRTISDKPSIGEPQDSTSTSYLQLKRWWWTRWVL